VRSWIERIDLAKRLATEITDTFGGSGSTLIACEQSERVCATVELDPGYCDVIVERWKKLTGGVPVRQGS